VVTRKNGQFPTRGGGGGGKEKRKAPGTKEDELDTAPCEVWGYAAGKRQKMGPAIRSKRFLKGGGETKKKALGTSQ